MSAKNNLSRRDFLALAGTAAAGAALLPRARAAEKRPFEVSASIYAWELHDEGVERVLDNLQQMAGVNSVYLLGIMHPELRPYGDPAFPHNPVRKTWMAEDTRCYWHPEWKRYGRVKPRLSDYAWLSDTDWLRVLTDAARKRGLRVGMELSHSLIDRERMEGEYLDLATRDVHGKVVTRGKIKWLSAPCSNHPATLEYLAALATDTVTNYGLDYFQTCLMAFDPALPDENGVCFCEHCHAAAREFGCDLHETQASLLIDPKDYRAIAGWNAFRFASVARVYRTLHEAAHAARPAVDLRYNIPSPSYPYYGINLPAMRPYLDSVRVLDYTEQDGDAGQMRHKEPWFYAVKQQLVPPLPLLSSVGVRRKATPELVREGVRIAVKMGAVGLGLGHYDGATFPLLRAVGEGLKEAGVRT
ncbi:MAG TPA: hypothetical protein VHE13_00315 [Opitutus sp.]|nr:hypothetical protein [Opitutus sp.]